MTISTAGLPLGTLTFFARLVDTAGNSSTDHKITYTLESFESPLTALNSSDTVSRNAALTLTAVTSNQQIDAVEFYHDANNDGILQPNGDLLLGIEEHGNFTGWFHSYPASSFPLGGNRFFARAVSYTGGVSETVSCMVTVTTDALPAISALEAPRAVIQPDTMTLNASGATADVVLAQFYLDSNNDGIFQPAADEFLGADSDGSDGWSLLLGTAFATGVQRFFVRVQDSSARWSDAASATTEIAAQAPSPATMRISTDSTAVTRSWTLTFRGMDFGPTNSPISHTRMVVDAEVYLDSNGDGQLQPESDLLLGPLTTPRGTRFYYSENFIPAAGWPSGTVQCLVRVQDVRGAWTVLEPVTLTVRNVAPTIARLAAPALVAPGADLTMTARAVRDDLAVTRVRFYHDSNRDGILQPESDTLLASQDVTPWQALTPGHVGVNVSTAGLADGMHRFFAIATDDEGMDGAAISTTVLISHQPAPAITLQSSPVRIAAPANVALMAIPTAGNAVAVEFYRDSNADGILQPETDELLGIDSYGADGWGILKSTAGVQPGTHTYFARARDGREIWGEPAAAAVTVTEPPAVGGLVLDADVITRKERLTLTATGLADADGAVVAVWFYRDADGNGICEPLLDEWLGTDTNSADGWSWSGLATGFASGEQNAFALALDSDGAWSAPASATIRVNNLPPTMTGLQAKLEISNGAPTLRLLVPKTSDLDGKTFRVEFYRDSNNDGILQPDEDELLGRRLLTASGAGGLLVTASKVKSGRYFARVRDEEGLWSRPTSAQVKVGSGPSAGRVGYKVPAKGQRTLRFTVVYSGQLPIRGESLGRGDIQVVGPKGFSELAELLSVKRSNGGKTVTAQYEVEAPGGRWDATDSGVYQIRLRREQVVDSRGIYAAAAKLETFQVRVGRKLIESQTV